MLWLRKKSESGRKEKVVLDPHNLVGKGKVLSSKNIEVVYFLTSTRLRGHMGVGKGH